MPMTYTPEQKQLIADEMTRILKEDDLTPLKDVFEQAVTAIMRNEYPNESETK